MNQKISAALGAALLCVSAASASAQEDAAKDLPINAPPNAVVKSSGGLYVWGDGGPWALSQQQKAAGASGDQKAAETPPLSQTASEVPLPTASVATTRGAVGYVLPSGALAPKWGSNVRAEFGASETTANLPQATGAGNPLVYNGVALGGCSACNAASTDYSSRQLSAKAASDYKFDNLTLTPSVTLFNGRSHQNFSGNSGSPALEWNDIGAKVGVEAKLDLNDQLAIGVGGSYGVAQRSVTVSGDTTAGADTAIPHLANGEAKLTYKPAEEFSFNGYAGVGNYDNKVPGVANAAGSIDYSPATNVYYGAGATYRFGTK